MSQRLSYEIPDPNKLTIQKLKSIITNEGFGEHLPADKAHKEVYVRIYEEHVVPVLRERYNARPPASRTPNPRASLPGHASITSRPKGLIAQTDLVNRRKTLHGDLPGDHDTVVESKIHLDKAPSTPTVRTSSSRPSADPERTRKALFSKSARASDESSSTSSAEPAASLRESHQPSTPIGQISYPKLPARTPTSPSLSSADHDLYRIIAAQHAQKKKARSFGRCVLFAAVILLLAVGAGLWKSDQLSSIFELEKEPYFCDTTMSFREQKEAGCMPCPLYGSCSKGKLVCPKGFFKSGRICVRDQEISRAINFCKEETRKLLARRAGELDCGYPIATRHITESELRKVLKQKVRDEGILDKWSEAKFNDSFYEMKKELQKPNEAPIIIKGMGTAMTFDTTEVDRPLACVLERMALEHIWYIIGIAIVLVIILRYLYIQRKKATLEDDITNMVHTTKELLKQKKKGGAEHVWVPVVELRDLQFFNSPDFEKRYKTNKERMAVWKSAEQRLRADTRIKEYSEMVADQQQVVWEYIGTVADEMAQNIFTPHTAKHAKLT